MNPIKIVQVYRHSPQEGTLSLFPSELVAGIAFSQEELSGMSITYSLLYKDLIEALARKVSNHFKISLPAALILTRPALVSLTHFFMDRLIRLNRFLTRNEDVNWQIAGVDEIKPPLTLDKFKELVLFSPVFNQQLLVRLAPLFEVEIVPPADHEESTEKKRFMQKSFINHNFASPFSRKVKRRLKSSLLKAIHYLIPGATGRILALSMAEGTGPLKDRGLYGWSGLDDLRQSLPFEAVLPDLNLRRDLLENGLTEIEPSFKRFLGQFGCRTLEIQGKVFYAFVSFLVDFYPPEFLEGIPQNLSACMERLGRSNKSSGLIIAEIGSVYSIYMMAAARSLGLAIIGCQHGGHYGYIDDHVNAFELEYAFCDSFITWGWVQFPDSPAYEAVKPVQLPSPWMSERQKMWVRRLGDKRYAEDKEFDLLLMTNKVYPFPPAPSGANISRIDHIHGFSEFLKGLVRECVEHQISILHKPYNSATMDLLRETLSEMEEIGGRYYHCYEVLNKGLTQELLEQCHIVLWEQPGTGLMECLVGEIPTMLLWPRLYSQEFPWTRPLFQELEEAGILHRNVSSLIMEYRNFKPSPLRWMQEGIRKNAIAHFCQEFCQTDPNWPHAWREFLKSLH